MTTPPYISKFLTRTSLRLITVAILALPLLATSASKHKVKESERDIRKSDYIFLEALNYQNQNKPDSYFALIEAAHELNSTDPYLGMQYGLKLMYESNGDSLQMARGLDYLRRYVEQNPADFHNALNYATLSSQYGQPDDALNAWKQLYDSNSDRIEVGGMYAEALARTGQADNVRKAIDIYNDIERMEGVNPTTSTRKMHLYNFLSDTSAVFAEMHSLLASAPRSAEYAAMAGNIFMELGSRDSALVFFDKAVDLEPNNGAVRYQRALYYETIGDSARYDSEIFQALQLPDLDVSPKLEMLYDYVRKLYADTLQQPRIESMFQTLVAQYPHEAQVRNLYGDYLITIGHFAPAAEQISYALDSDPSDAKRWQTLGSLYFTLKDMAKARETAERALKFHPDAPNLYTMASSVSISEKNYPEAIAFLHKGLEVADSTDYDIMSTLFCSLGDTFYAASAKDSAFVYYEKALQYNPENLLALNNCAYYLACEDRDLDRALKMIEKVIAEDATSSTTLDTYAWVLFKRKDYEKAKEVIDGALANEENPELSAEFMEHAGDIYFMNGEPDKALDFWRNALKIDPDNELLKRKVKHKTFFFK